MFYLLYICINKIAIVSYSKETAAFDVQSKVDKYKKQTRDHIINTMRKYFQDPNVDKDKMWKQIFEISK